MECNIAISEGNCFNIDTELLLEIIVENLHRIFGGGAMTTSL